MEWSHINLQNKTFRKVQVKTKKLLPMELPLDFELKDNEALYSARNSIDRRKNTLLEKISRELGFDRTITFHQARHSFAVMAINKGVRIEVLSKLLGHSSIIATEKTYARFLRSTMDDEIRKVMEW